GGAAGGVALDDVQFGQGGVPFLTVGQLGGQPQAIHDALAPGQFARLARRFAGARGFHDLAADDLGVVRFFLQVVGRVLATMSSTGPRTSDDTSLSLVWELN